MKPYTLQSSRRHFLKTAAALAAGAAAGPLLVPRSLWGADSPSQRITMGFIGMGIQSRGLLHGFLNSPKTRVVAVCDVDTTRRNDAKRKVDEHYSNSPEKRDPCAAYNDFREVINRKDIDAVCIATPDHWHAIITLAALRAGKDVYCEKPLTHNIHEAIEVIRAVDANQRVLQTGSMQRSSKEFRVACELVLNGAIGKVQRVECSFGDPAIPCNLGEEPVEPGLDWNFWVGPAPMRPYNSVLSPRGLHNHFPNWRNYKEFGGGMVTDWGAHHLDIAQWGLGMDNSGPVEVRPPEKAGAKRGAKLVYANGVTVEHKDGFGVHFYGADGEVLVNRGQFVFKRGSEVVASFTGQKDTNCNVEVQKAEQDFLKDAKIKLYASSNHLTDFLNCVQSRKKPITSEQVGGRSAICCHLMNLTYWHGQTLKWNPEQFAFAGGTGDAQWLTREYRSPWKV
ncbi:MAG TPA: Gfo/Idh/MocA family oxidoreductase [Candidatus Sulfotelmatobacter sp.]|nr:Gfo/Idh/MocA family oxidoreductase [Candidatus Sulfotelmatobacter sp.]